MKYLIIPKEQLTAYKSIYNKHSVNFKVFPLSKKEKETISFDAVKIGFSEILLSKHLQIMKEILTLKDLHDKEQKEIMQKLKEKYEKEYNEHNNLCSCGNVKYPHYDVCKNCL